MSIDGRFRSLPLLIAKPTSLAGLSVGVVLCLAIVFVAGCDSASPPKQESGSDENDSTRAHTDAKASTKSSATDLPETDATDLAVSTDESGRKWLTAKVPYDVFPDLPSAAELIASRGSDNLAPAPIDIAPTEADSSPDGISPDGETAKPATGQKTADAMTPAPSATTPVEPPSSDTPAQPASWDAILPVAVLDDEISAVRNRLEQNLLTFGSFNGNFADVAHDAWEMSALATIAAAHSGDISWKEQALLARDAAVAIANAAKKRGRKSFLAAEIAGEQVSALLNNNMPAGMDAAKPDRSRTETADRAALMSRIQKSYDQLQLLAGDQATLGKNLDEINRQARVMAALAKFVAHTDYPDAKNKDYQSAAANLRTAGMNLTQAATDGDLAAYQKALQSAGESCTACHKKYRFGQ